jgi:hypothetical protein
MIKLTFITTLFLLTNTLFAQKVIRSSIGPLGSSSKGRISIVAGSPISSPVLHDESTSSGITIQTRPFINLQLNGKPLAIEINVYPNPTNDMVFIRTTAEYKSIIVYDMIGRNVYKGTNKNISLGDLMSGVYIIEIILIDNSNYYQKLILNK